jgi:quinol monooxygenase YgiN
MIARPKPNWKQEIDAVAERNDERSRKMIFVYCKLSPKPEKEDEFLSLIKNLIGPTREEPGCISFELVKAIGGDSYVLIEKFNDRAAIDAHINMEHFQTVFPQLKKLLAAPPEVTNHDLIY